MGEPERVGHYRLLEPIGTGGFATVHRAIDERLDSEVAIKILAENHALDPDIRERFITEAQLLRRVASPAVIEIHDIGETDRNQPFIVMTLADRGDLRRRVAELTAANGGAHPTLSLQDVREVTEVLARALDAVHRSGLVHRDVKPDNLLISSHGGPLRPGAELLAGGERIRLGDLGYAKDLAASSGLTVGGGTHGFNAPEQRQGLTTVDARADVYGASAVVFWLLTGTTPPASDRDQRDALLLTPSTDSMTDALVAGLRADASDRHPTIGDWSAAMFGDPGPLRPSTVGMRSGGRGRRSFAAATIAAVAGLALGIGGSQLLFSDSVDQPTTGTTDDGRVRVQRNGSDMRIAIFGSPTATVGEPATFDAAVVGAASYAWAGPDGALAEGTPAATFTFGDAGSHAVTLIARNADGDTLTVDFGIEVEE